MQNKIIALKYAQVGCSILFSCTDGSVRDFDGNKWVKEFYRGNQYFRQSGGTNRISLKTVKHYSKPCNVLL